MHMSLVRVVILETLGLMKTVMQKKKSFFYLLDKIGFKIVGIDFLDLVMI